MKRILSATLALALGLSLGGSALAASGGYAGSITVNGTALDTASLPAAPAGAVYLPLRAVAEADYGFADWYADENRSYFALDENRVYVDCATGAIEVNGETVSGMTAAFAQGTTYVPVGLMNQLEGYTAAVKGSDITITTPNGESLTRLARSIIDQVGMGATMKQDAAGMEELYGVPASCFTQAVGFFPMMISADTIIIGQVAEGQMEAAQAALEEVRATTQRGFENYLPEPLERAKNGRVVTSGDYIMLIISGDNDAAIDLFRAGVEGLEQPSPCRRTTKDRPVRRSTGRSFVGWMGSVQPVQGLLDLVVVGGHHQQHRVPGLLGPGALELGQVLRLVLGLGLGLHLGGHMGLDLLQGGLGGRLVGKGEDGQLLIAPLQGGVDHGLLRLLGEAQVGGSHVGVQRLQLLGEGPGVQQGLGSGGGVIGRRGGALPAGAGAQAQEQGQRQSS